MPCRGWEERIVADVYDEVEPAERRELARHLADCPDCRAVRESLTEARQALAEARPADPIGPRVIVLAPRPRRAASYAVAASLAGLGLLAGVSLSWSWQARIAAESAAQAGATARPAAVEPATHTPTRAEIEGWLDARAAEIVAAQRGARPATPGAANPITRPEVEAMLTRVEKRLDRGRSADVRYLIDAINGIEARTGARLGETQQAIRYLALANDPRISEQ